MLAVGPLIYAGLVVFAYPETARRDLDDINPEDRPRATSALKSALEEQRRSGRREAGQPGDHELADCASAPLRS